MGDMQHGIDGMGSPGYLGRVSHSPSGPNGVRPGKRWIEEPGGTGGTNVPARSPCPGTPVAGAGLTARGFAVDAFNEPGHPEQFLVGHRRAGGHLFGPGLVLERAGEDRVDRLLAALEPGDLGLRFGLYLGRHHFAEWGEID